MIERSEASSVFPDQDVFLAVGQKVAELSDVVLAVWNGGPAKWKSNAADVRLMPEVRAIVDEAKPETILHAIRNATAPEDPRRVWTR